jgi:L-ascorbate metabolism protein UlaG (beta-lactamase superfamily)
MIIALAIVVCIFVIVYLFMRHPKFGKAPSGARLERIKNSPNYKDGQFDNLSFTPTLKEGVTYYTVMKEFFFDKSKRSKPSSVIPSVKTNLHNLPPDKNVLVWFGHSSYFLQVDGKRILVDPVFSGSASPVSFTTRSFAGANVYSTEDMPAIDYLFISHDHWDHLDYETVIKLKPKVDKIITSLGVGAHLEHWNFDMSKVIEKDWNEEIQLDLGFIVYTKPGRHFSGRGLKRNQSIWSSFVLQTPTTKLFLGGDSGYDTHFKTIGEQYGPFDLAILECGQYNEYWHHIHLMPEEVVQAAQDLQAKNFIPVHWAKFSLSLHAWDEPITRVKAEAVKRNVPILHPMIGEAVDIKNPAPSTEWWLKVDN